jgi:flagellar hook-length control protein FliK
MPAAIAPSDTVPAVGDIEGALPPLVQPLAPGEALLPQKAQASVSGSELSLPVADLTRVGAVADPLPALPPGAADARSKPAPALRAAPIPAVVPAQDGAVLQPGNERALAPEPGLPDGLLARAADTLQPATSATPTLGQALFGVTDATGEPLLSQRLESAAPLLPRPGDRAWDGEFAGRLTMMVRNGVQEASLQLKPAELGRLEIQIATEGDQTRVHFLVQNAAAREAIEQAMPRLREMLEQSGLQLAQSDVADQSQSGGRERTYAGEQSGEPAAVDAELLTEDAPHSLHALRGRSMVDHYV